MKKIGIITFHNSYNCGSMLESYAMQEVVKKIGYEPEIINYASKKQSRFYYHWYKNDSPKNIIKNLLIFPHIKKIKNNNYLYEKFKEKYFNLSKKIEKKSELYNLNYSSVISGSDQIWNITIDDYDEAYFLNWATGSKKIAYAPSFGAKNIKEYATKLEYNKLRDYLNSYDALSIRENNGKKWLKQIIHKDVKVLLDPTLLLKKEDYEKIIDKSIIKHGYIFYYNPSYSKNSCKFVKKIAKKYGLEVYCWSAKNFYVKTVWKYGFKLVEAESPSIYLNYIKNADLVITGSFHGTIFSTIYRKKFFTIYDGSYGNDDRNLTLVTKLGITNRYIDCIFNENQNYLENVDYSKYEKKLNILIKEAYNYLKNNIE